MVDDHVGLHLRVDHLGIAAKRLDGIAHRGQIDHAWHAGEVLHHHTRGGELDLMARIRRRIPCEQFPHLLVGDVGAVDVAHQVLDQHLQRVRQVIDAFKIGDAVVVIRLVAHLEDIQLFVAQRHSSSEISWMLRAINTTGRLCQPFFSRLYCEMRHQSRSRGPPPASTWAGSARTPRC